MTTYTTPLAEIVCVRFEQNVMSPVYGAKNAAGGDITDGNTYDL